MLDTDTKGKIKNFCQDLGTFFITNIKSKDQELHKAPVWRVMKRPQQGKFHLKSVSNDEPAW